MLEINFDKLVQTCFLTTENIVQIYVNKSQVIFFLWEVKSEPVTVITYRYEYGFLSTNFCQRDRMFNNLDINHKIVRYVRIYTA